MNKLNEKTYDTLDHLKYFIAVWMTRAECRDFTTLKTEDDSLACTAVELINFITENLQTI